MKLSTYLLITALTYAIPNCDGGGDRSCQNDKTKECYDVTNCTTCNTAGRPWACVNAKCPGSGGGGGGLVGRVVDLVPSGADRWTTNYGLMAVGTITTTDTNGTVTQLDNLNTSSVHVEVSRIDGTLDYMRAFNGMAMELTSVGPTTFPLFDKWDVNNESVMIGSITITDTNGNVTRLDTSNAAAVHIKLSRLEPQVVEAASVH